MKFLLGIKTYLSIAIALQSVLLSSTAIAQQVPVYQQILERLKSDVDVVLPWISSVHDTETMYNREAPVQPQCYTDTGGDHNPCYVCHQNRIPGRENTMDDRDLQEAYSFSDVGLTNHWLNLFEDRSERVAAISDQEILQYISQDNYSELPQRLRGAGFTGWIPDLKNLAQGAAAFDADGFALDGSQWVAFNYKPLPSTFWPTQGSTDDVMIRLPREFYTTATGTLSRAIYKANLAILEANIKGYAQISSWPINETEVGEDLNNDGALTVVSRVSSNRAHYVGGASKVELIPYVYPLDTEFLHTVRYVGVASDGSIHNAARMKEVRYMKRRIQSRHFQLQHFYEEENLEKEMASLPTYKNLGHQGLSSNFGWNITGFIENKQGRLRWNTYEENVYCMGCHTTIGSTIDKTFSFPRKVDGAAGWGYINLRALRDAPNVGEANGEAATYFSRVGGGTEFRSNPELDSRFYNADGSLNSVALASTRSFYDMVAPTAARALLLDKAYKAIVEEQDFVFGRDATITPPARVLMAVDPQNSPTLPPNKQHDWNILLDWSAADAWSCNYQGDVDFSQLAAAHVVTLGANANDFTPVCAGGTVALSGDLVVTLASGVQPAVGSRFEIVRGESLTGGFDQIELPVLAAGSFKIQKTNNAVILIVTHDSDSDGISDDEDNCSTIANGTSITDAGGYSQRDTDEDGYGNMCDADFNNDGAVNSVDSSRFRSRFGSRDPHADFNGDGIVNSIDSTIFRKRYGSPPGPARTIVP
jgi:hypothetical protein